ncbi:MAG: glycosyltransferase family 2 protein [Verrucomicrobia bacterium]|nr:glycosyltransferase family 2 protein [Verrucomicrobiota bacterium]
MVWTICYFTVALGLSAYGVHRYFIIYLYFRNRHRAPSAANRFSKLPRVTVQLPIYNEIYVVERLLRAVSNLDYPLELLEIQVLDDSTDETQELVAREVARLRAAGFDAVILQRPNRTGFKAGALDHGLQSAKGEFLFILDADFIPPRNILKHTIHHFVNPEVGMIQTRWGHLNRGYSWLTRAQAILLDGHLVLEQTARSRTGRFFNFNGTAGLWRKSCIVESGGWQHDTLTEDLDLSYRAQLRGWKFVFLGDIVTPAELPVDIDGFKSQQHRWTKGSIQTCKKVLPRIWRSRLPLYIKLEATAHLSSNFAYLLLACLCVLLHPAPSSPAPSAGWVRAVLVDLPIFVATTFSVAVFYLCAQRELYPREWKREIWFFPFVLALGIGLSINNARAVIEAVFNRRSDFTRTPKYGIQSKGDQWRNNRYSALRTLIPIVELLFAIYFTYFVFNAFQNREFLSVPFLMLFQGGFAYVAISSILQRIGRSSLGSRDISVA